MLVACGGRRQRHSSASRACAAYHHPCSGHSAFKVAVIVLDVVRAIRPRRSNGPSKQLFAPFETALHCSPDSDRRRCRRIGGGSVRRIASRPCAKRGALPQTVEGKRVLCSRAVGQSDRDRKCNVTEQQSGSRLITHLLHLGHHSPALLPTHCARCWCCSQIRSALRRLRAAVCSCAPTFDHRRRTPRGSLVRRLHRQRHQRTNSRHRRGPRSVGRTFTATVCSRTERRLSSVICHGGAGSEGEGEGVD